MVDNWIVTSIPLIRLLVSYFHLKYVFIFCRHDLSTSCPFDPAIPVIQDAIPSWRLYQHTFISTEFGAIVSCCRSCLYISPIPLPTPSLFSPPLPPFSPNTIPWLSHIFKSPSFILLTTTNLPSLHDSISPCTLFDKVKIYAFTNNNDTTPLTSNHVIYDPNHPVSEPNLTSSDGIFDE